MITLYDNSSGSPIGTINDADLEFLRTYLEEESSEDQDYWIDTATLDLLDANAAPHTLLALLRTAMAGKPGVEIRWEPAPGPDNPGENPEARTI
jgi:hypothetical protein